MEDINVVVTSSGVSLEETLIKKVVKALNEEAHKACWQSS